MVTLVTVALTLACGALLTVLIGARRAQQRRQRRILECRQAMNVLLLGMDTHVPTESRPRKRERWSNVTRIYSGVAAGASGTAAWVRGHPYPTLAALAGACAVALGPVLLPSPSGPGSSVGTPSGADASPYMVPEPEVREPEPPDSIGAGDVDSDVPAPSPTPPRPGVTPVPDPGPRPGPEPSPPAAEPEPEASPSPPTEGSPTPSPEPEPSPEPSPPPDAEPQPSPDPPESSPEPRCLVEAELREPAHAELCVPRDILER